MIITVWTSWASMASNKPKCIFVGASEILPRIGEEVILRDGFNAEKVRTVTINLVTQEAEITVDTEDPENNYGESLL